MIDDRMTQAIRSAFNRHFNKAIAGNKVGSAPRQASTTPTPVSHQEVAAFIKQAGISVSEAGQALQTAAKMMSPFIPSVQEAAESHRRWQQSRQQPPNDWRD